MTNGATSHVKGTVDVNAQRPWIVSVNYSSECASCATLEAAKDHASEIMREAWGEIAKLSDGHSVSLRRTCGCQIGAARAVLPNWDGKPPKRMVERELPPHTKRGAA